LLAAATVALAVADVILTSQFYCVGQDYSKTYCWSTGEPYVWVWVASGIWGGIPIFFTGIYLMTVGADAVKLRYAMLMIMLSAFVFAPDIIILTAVELAKGSASTWTFYSFGNGSLAKGNIQPSGTNPWEAKFAIPLTVTILACLMFLITLWIVLRACCCGTETAVVVEEPECKAPPVVVQPPPPQPVFYEAPRPQYVALPPAPAPPPCNPCGQPLVSVSYNGGGCNSCPSGVNVATGAGNVYRSW